MDASFPLPAGTHDVSIDYFDRRRGRRQSSGGTPARRRLRRRRRARRHATLSEDGWTLDGFSLVGAQVVEDFEHFYIAGSRSYVSYDQYLKTGPYFFGYNPTFPDKVDHYSYQEGLLISYNNTLYTDNDTFAHPGFGRNLYIDAHPTPMPRAESPTGDGYWRARVQVYDAPFGAFGKTDKVTLHIGGATLHVRRSAGRVHLRRHQAVLVLGAAEPRRQAPRPRCQDPSPHSSWAARCSSR